MNRITILLGFAVLVMASSCAKTGDLEIIIKGKYGEVPLVMNTSLDYDYDEKIQLTKSDFLIAELELIDDNGNTVSISDVEFIELTTAHLSEADALIGFSIPVEDLPKGSYTTLNFGVGVPPGLNAMQPGDFDINHPLGNSSFFWPGWSSYIFSKTEGKIDTLGGSNFDLNFLYHSGSDPLYREVSIPINIEVSPSETAAIELELDHKAIFFRDGKAMDIKTEPLSHSPGQSLDFPTFIMDNFPGAFSVK